MAKNKKQVILLILVVAVLTGVGVYRLAKPPAERPADRTGAMAPEEGRQEKTEVYLYFAAAADTFLVAEKRTVHGAADPISLSKKIIDALISGPTVKNLVRTVPAETACRAFYLTDDGVAYADFSAGIRDRHPGGSEAELLTIYSIVNSLVLNVAEVKKVGILIEGDEVDTLAGHIDLRFPFDANMRMVR